MRRLSDHLPLRTRTAAGLAALALVAVPLSACGGDDSSSADAGASGSPTGAAAPGETGSDASDPATGGSADGETGSEEPGSSGGSADGGSDPDDQGGTDGGTANGGSGGANGGSSNGGSGGNGGGTGGGGAAADPNSPFVVAATAVAARSRDQVTQLHAMGVATTGEGGLPADQLPALGENIRGELGRQIEDATMLPPPAGSPAAKLVAALEDYRTLAGRLAAWKPDGAALPQAWFGRLASTDRAWKASLRELGQLSQQDLLADLAPLAMPS